MEPAESTLGLNDGWLSKLDREMRRSGEGWKDSTVNDDYVKHLCHALAIQLNVRERSVWVAIAADNRPHSQPLTHSLSDILADLGFEVARASEPVSGPIFSHYLASVNRGPGIYVSASHRPFGWFGVKIKTRSGSMAPATFYDDIEALMVSHIEAPRQRKGRVISLESGSLLAAYTKNANVLMERATRLTERFAIVDTGNISSHDFLKIAKNLGLPFDEVPIQIPDVDQYQDPSALLVVANKNLPRTTATLAALDPDGDSASIHVAGAPALGPAVLVLMCIRHLIGRLGRGGTIFLELGMPRGLQRIITSWGLPSICVDGRFSAIHSSILAWPGFLGADENGNIAHRLSNFHRDGIMAILFAYADVGNTRRSSQQTISDIVNSLAAHHFRRWDAPAITQSGLKRISDDLSKDLRGTLVLRKGTGTVEISSQNEDWWIMIRPSTTEEKLRVRGELPPGHAEVTRQALGISNDAH